MQDPYRIESDTKSGTQPRYLFRLRSVFLFIIEGRTPTDY